VEINTSSTDKYKKYNDNLSKPESGSKYNGLNSTNTEIIDGKKVVTQKPVEQWAIGRYQHYYRHQEHKIIPALEEQGIDTSSLSKEDIARAYQNSPKAQEVVQAKINDENFAAAEKQIKKHGLTKAPIEEVAFLNHFLGNDGAEHYLNLVDKYGVKKADQIMAYGGDPDRPKFNGVGGPESKKNKNALVSEHINEYRKSAEENRLKQSKSNIKSTAVNNPVTPKETKITAKNLNSPFDEVVNSYTKLTEGNLNGIDELQYNPMGWGADKGVKIKGQKWRNHDNHIHLTFTDPQVAIAVIKKAQEIGLNPNENLYVGEVHDVHKRHPVTKEKLSMHYFNFDGEFDGKKLSKGLDINFKNTGLTAKEGHAKMAQLYKWIHQTYSI
jgi:hypothetical protein